ncbi:hypothetical protein C1752_04335 [Acaryochloris thomasi RCC1774]|uniref:H repeat-associated protein N-terminal domain-containing protein n=1 Tax=Acaryochloris thomasi RCC1774 TaxID=1764569 RepID=A0A2W1JDS7_9CYAN|nr:hypothetical protein C1752_04335 [Acaryochloris thomasi RCC1774]
MSSLIAELKQILDFRKARGKSYPLWVLLLLIIMGILAGYHGYRPLQTFVEEHHRSLCQLLGFKELAAPSYSTFWRVMLGLDFLALSHQFEHWMGSQGAIDSPDNRVASIDDKRIRQRLTNAAGKERFVGLVSLFAVEVGVTLKLEALTQ